MSVMKRAQRTIGCTALAVVLVSSGAGLALRGHDPKSGVVLAGASSKAAALQPSASSETPNASSTGIKDGDSKSGNSNPDVTVSTSDNMTGGGHTPTRTHSSDSGPTTGNTGTTSNVSNSPTVPAQPTTTVTTVVTASAADLTDPTRKNRASKLITSFGFSTLTIQYNYVERTNDDCGIAAGRDGFCSGYSDLLDVVEDYTAAVPNNGLAKFLPAMRKVSGTGSTSGLSGFEAAFRAEDAGVNQAMFRKVQDDVDARIYLNPAMAIAKQYGVTSALGQTIIWDTAIHSGVDNATSAAAETASKMGGSVKGNEGSWLSTYLDVRVSHDDGDDPVVALRSILNTGNLQLNAPLTWTVWGDTFTLTS